MPNLLLRNIVIVVILASLISCDKGEDDVKPIIPVSPADSIVKLHPIIELINGDELIKDSVWKDSINHTVYLKVGPKFMATLATGQKIYPGAIVGTKQALRMEGYNSEIENLPVVLNFSQSNSTQVAPAYESFMLALSSFLEKKQPVFQQTNSDNGRQFSTYNDLVLINGYGKLEIKNWLTINNKQTKPKKTGIVFTFKSVDFNATINIPRGDELLDRDKYKAQIAADTLCYINQIDFGKRAFLTLMCDTTIDVARNIVSKLQKDQELNNWDFEILKNGEVGYYLQGFKNSSLPEGSNEYVIKRFFEEIRSSESLSGVPIDFYMRKIKDLSPYQTSLKIDIIRK